MNFLILDYSFFSSFLSIMGPGKKKKKYMKFLILGYSFFSSSLSFIMGLEKKTYIYEPNLTLTNNEKSLNSCLKLMATHASPYFQDRL